MNKPWRGKGSRKLYDLSSPAADPHYFPPITRLGGAWETAGCSPETHCLGLTGGSSAQQKADIFGGHDCSQGNASSQREGTKRGFRVWPLGGRGSKGQLLPQNPTI